MRMCVMDRRMVSKPLLIIQGQRPNVQETATSEGSFPNHLRSGCYRKCNACGHRQGSSQLCLYSVSEEGIPGDNVGSQADGWPSFRDRSSSSTPSSITLLTHSGPSEQGTLVTRTVASGQLLNPHYARTLSLWL